MNQEQVNVVRVQRHENLLPLVERLVVAHGQKGADFGSDEDLSRSVRAGTGQMRQRWLDSGLRATGATMPIVEGLQLRVHVTLHPQAPCGGPGTLPAGRPPLTCSRGTPLALMPAATPTWSSYDRLASMRRPPAASQAVTASVTSVMLW